MLGEFATSSPRQRGCFSSSFSFATRRIVFPAPAVVFLRLLLIIACVGYLPRSSGGVCTDAGALLESGKSSPRQRGCFCFEYNEAIVFQVFHAPAGVFLTPLMSNRPHTVFPAPAGVFLSPDLEPVYAHSIPRAAGVFPDMNADSAAMKGLPRAAGVLLSSEPIDPWRGCLPRAAGVFLPTVSTCIGLMCLPRASGSASAVLPLLNDWKQPSPRQRGCFPSAAKRVENRVVFPVPAGVLPVQSRTCRFVRSSPAPAVVFPGCRLGRRSALYFPRACWGVSSLSLSR